MSWEKHTHMITSKWFRFKIAKIKTFSDMSIYTKLRISAEIWQYLPIYDQIFDSKIRTLDLSGTVQEDNGLWRSNFITYCSGAKYCFYGILMRVNAIYSRLAASHCALAGRRITISQMLPDQQPDALSVSAARQVASCALGLRWLAASVSRILVVQD